MIEYVFALFWGFKTPLIHINVDVLPLGMLSPALLRALGVIS